VWSITVAIAMHSEITVYDAMYVAVAGISETGLVTTDVKLVEALARTEFKNYVQWLGPGLAVQFVTGASSDGYTTRSQVRGE
jgi:hypothetical protein